MKAFLIPLQFHFFLALVLNRNLALAKSYVNMSEGIVEYVSCSLAGHSMLLDSCELGWLSNTSIHAALFDAHCGRVCLGLKPW